MVVYDNINFTLRKASQRLDNATHQINATTLAVISLPAKFTRAAYEAALSVAARNKNAGLRNRMTPDEIKPTSQQQAQLGTALKHNIRMILLDHTPGLRKHKKLAKKLRKETKKLKPIVRVLEHKKTEFFPLPALNEEEASIRGTIKVVTSIFLVLLDLAREVVQAELRLLVGDWLTIRNLRLMKDECADELSAFERLNWVQEASMPFHFQLSALYMLVRTHIGHTGDKDPASLEHHRAILRRSKLDPKKPKYNKAKELVMHSLIARIIDCTR